MVNSLANKTNTTSQEIYQDFGCLILSKQSESACQLEWSNKKSGSIYLFNAVGSNRYKIGHTKCLNTRLKTLNSLQAPFQIKQIASFKCYHALWFEKSLHNYFEHKTCRGEWFTFTDCEIEEEILPLFASESKSFFPFEYLREKVTDVIIELITQTIKLNCQAELPDFLIRSISLLSFKLAYCFDPLSNPNVRCEDLTGGKDSSMLEILNSTMNEFPFYLFGNVQLQALSSSMVDYEKRWHEITSNKDVNQDLNNAILQWLGFVEGKMYWERQYW